MKKNVGKTDKVVRFILAVVLFVIGLVADIGTALKVVVFVFSGIAFFTALFGTWPLYWVLGISTIKKKE